MNGELCITLLQRMLTRKEHELNAARSKVVALRQERAAIARMLTEFEASDSGTSS